MGLLGRLLEPVEVGKGADDGLHAKLVRKALGLLRGANVKGEVELVEEVGSSEDLAEEGAANIAWFTSQQ